MDNTRMDFNTHYFVNDEMLGFICSTRLWYTCMWKKLPKCHTHEKTQHWEESPELLLLILSLCQYPTQGLKKLKLRWEWMLDPVESVRFASASKGGKQDMHGIPAGQQGVRWILGDTRAQNQAIHVIWWAEFGQLVEDKGARVGPGWRSGCFRAESPMF